MNEVRQIVLNNGEGNSFWVLGDLYTFKATGEQTNGAFTVIDQVIQPEGGPPPHIHHREDEAFYVLEGKFSFLSAGKQTEAGAGSFYAKCGFREVGRVRYRTVPLIYFEMLL